MSRSKYRPRHNFGNGGPRWFRNGWTTRPLRQESRRILHRVEPDAEPMLTADNRKRPWWW